MRCDPTSIVESGLALALVLALAPVAHAQDAIPGAPPPMAAPTPPPTTPVGDPPPDETPALSTDQPRPTPVAPEEAPALSTDQLRPAPATLDSVPARGVVGALELGVGRGGADGNYQPGLGYALMVGYRVTPITVEARLERYDLRDPVNASTTEGRVKIMSVASRVARGPFGLIGGVARVTQPVLSEVGADGSDAFVLQATEIAGVGAVLGAGLAIGAQRWQLTLDARAYLCVWEIERALAVTELASQPDGTWTYERAASDRGGGLPLTVTAGLRLLL